MRDVINRVDHSPKRYHHSNYYRPAHGYQLTSSQGDVSRPIRVAIVNSHPIPYFTALYAYLNRDPTLDITVLYCSDSSLRDGFDRHFGRVVTWDIELLCGYSHAFLGARSGNTPGGFWSLVCPRLWMTIRKGNYDVVLVHGYQYAACFVAFAAALSKHIPIIVRSETHLRLRRSAWRQTARDATVSRIYSFVDAFLAVGTANRAYYRSLGVPEAKIFDAPYAVDNQRFSAGANLDGDLRAQLRHKYHLPVDGTVVLYASRFVPRKHPETVIRAVAALQNAGESVTLFMVGSGEAEAALRRLAAMCQPGTVVFGGFVNQTELPHIYGASDIFVLPAENEPWGLVVNEAMCAGLPIVVSDEIGCAADLVREGVNGCLVKAGDVMSLAKALETLLSEWDPLESTCRHASLSIL